MSLFRIENPGPLTTVQDNGRQGYQRHGLAQGGAADRHAFMWANKLLENAPGSACLELAFGGFEAVALAPVTVAVTGAAWEVQLNEDFMPTWRTLELARGDRLRIPPVRHGRFSYLAIPGGVLSETVFGSQSVVMREGVDGLNPIAAGDVIGGKSAGILPQRVVPLRFQRRYESPVLCRVIAGYQYHQFSGDDRHRLFGQRYTVSSQSDRMGFKLSGAPLQSPPSGVISEGVALGSIQVPGDGNPIVLLNDRQTIGGYPKIGVVSTLDCSRLVQALPGQQVAFALTDLEAMQSEWLMFERFFQVSRWNPSGTDLSWGG
ncbi:5-oxoprolinase subunit C family protein [Marinobacter zhejiangensis]|uniref:Biotin-dependent carboxylase uncharacterized domain-containing protein n=1 Tax=Marinobacter zhejiangensis TaxID=488535 RepID=A0A1I4RW68_9GAMM|nr:biotin-dependent carboxyltransferase family protein [Marinobacter zhejiangensis]SFM56441.1 biotin-dependent carboxylase uncharacterized domain-containing protein [Marinobacter zhejiangensis]